MLVDAALEDTDVVQTFRQPFDHKVVVNGKELAKSRALAQYSKYQKQVGSTNCLKRVQGIERYAQNSVSIIPNLNNSLSPDVPVLMISDPVATLLCCDNHAWLCIGEVNGLKVDGQYADFVTQLQSHISSWDCGRRLWMMIHHLFSTGGLVELKRILLQYLGNLFNRLISLFQHSNPTPFSISLIVSSSSHWQQVYSNISLRQTSKMYLN